MKEIFCEIEKITSSSNVEVFENDKISKFNLSAWSNFGKLKIHGAFLSADMGGLNFNFRQYANLLQKLGETSEDNGLNFTIMAHALACLWPISIYCTKNSEINKLLPDFACGKLILSNAITESSGGSNVYAMKTTASRNGNSFIINGKKSFCSNGTVASHALVYAETSAGKGFFGGISAFLIPLNLPGISIGNNFEKMGLKTAPSCEISFTQVSLPEQFLIGKEGIGATIFQESMVFEKIFMAASHCGTLTRWLKNMELFAKSRISGESPISKNQSIMHVLADVKILLETGKALLNEALNKLVDASLSEKIAYSAIVKLSVSSAMVNCSQKMVNLFAGEGFKADNGVERQHRDFMGSTIYSGTNDIQKNIIYASIGK